MAIENDLSSNEKALIKAVSENSLAKVIETITRCQSASELNINCLDEHGMSPLQHACYKGNVEIASYLIERGADVNQNNHEHRYTSLMFAALGGHIDVINLLLEHGAKTDTVNTVGRNASQMAAFVGQHQSVAAINNYIPRSHLEYFNHCHGQEKEPRLPLRFTSALHSLVCLTTINPIRVAYYLNSNIALFEEAKKISSVLETLCEKFLQMHEPLEMLSLKIHFYNFIFSHLNKVRLNHSKDDKSSQRSEQNSHLYLFIYSTIKHWLRLNSNGFSENIERLLRESIRSYPFKDNSLFQQLVRTLSSIEIGDEPSAQTILSQTILGKANGSDDQAICFTCSEIKPKKRCSKCKQATYCDELCQRLHWPQHKSVCKATLSIPTETITSRSSIIESDNHHRE
ncbi:GPCR-like protein family B [Sarcoptes scabiei]|nr:GPCR-like protein family B [Sarcoptes scabiei]